MGSTASSLPDPDKEEQTENQEAKHAETIPSVLVNYEFLNLESSKRNQRDLELEFLNFDKSQRNQKVFEVDGKTYEENLETCENFEEFKLYAERIQFNEAVEDNEIETSPKRQNFEAQISDDGYIIDSSIFLNFRHYHTLINLFDDCLNCFVCDDIVLQENCDSHVDSEHHQRNLEACPPLEEYRLNIFRLKNDHYHCGICNEVFHISSRNYHFARQVHANNKIFATDKATDIVKRNRNNDTKNKNNDMQNKNNDTQSNNNDDEIIQENNIALDSRVSVRTEKKTFKISYYTWHMISISKDKAFYCMACKLKEPIDELGNHIDDISHKNNLKRFKINEAYENHLIRQDDKWSHCSTCNTVHYLDGTDLHITRHRIRKTSTESATTKTENNNNDNINKNNDTHRNENNDTQSTSHPKIIQGVANVIEKDYFELEKAIINEKCFVDLFGFKVYVSFLSLNVIFYDESGFFHCVFCNVNFLAQTVKDHIKSPLHNAQLNSTPAILHYGYNYIRAINYQPHCGICHILLHPSLLLLHLQDPSHIMQTNKALGLVNLAPPPPQVAKVVPNMKNHNQNLKDAQNKTDESNDFNTTHKIENRINATKNKIEVIKNAIIETKNTSNESRNRINESVKIKKTDVYIEVNKSKIHEIELNYEDDYNTGIFEAEIEVFTKKARVLILFTSFNTLVPIGDGDRYCFACGVSVENDMLKNHICSKSHMEMINDIKFLEEYNYDLIRQNTSLYHCALCNTIVRRSELPNHIEWTAHEEHRKKSKKNVNKKERNSTEYQNELFPTNKEVIHSSKCKEIIVKLSMTIKAKESNDINPTVQTKKEETKQIIPKIEAARNNKTIIIDDLNIKVVLKWDSWHSIIRTKNKYMCIICNEKLNDIYLDLHMSSVNHTNKLEKPFITKYFPALIRETTAVMFHCATCNIVIYDKRNIRTHIYGSKHKRQLEDLLNNSRTRNLDDSNEDVIII